MRIVSLNTWGGRVFDPLMEFIKREAPATDVFCFQEMLFGDMAQAGTEGWRENLYDEIANILPDFEGFPGPVAAGFGLGGGRAAPAYLRGGMAMFAKKNLKAGASDIVRLFDPAHPLENGVPNPINGSMQYLQVENEDGLYTIASIYGIWQVGTKGDTPERLQQSTKLLQFFKQIRNRKILIGDFNLHPDTQSILAFNNDFKNLIQDFGITNTRNHYYADMEKYKDYIADYAFVSPDMTVQKFEVLPDEVSDHAPLALECV